jgi:hypothetical protein
MITRTAIHLSISTLAFPAFLSGCSGDVAPGDGAQTSSSSSSGMFDPGGDVTTYESGMGPITAQAGEEDTRCITIRLGNAEGAYVRRFRAELNAGSHHMIVYLSDDTTEQPTPSPCGALGGVFQGDHPIFIAQQDNAELVFPTEGSVPVGFQIQPNQMLRFEIHYLNATTAPLGVQGKVLLDTIPLSVSVIPSDLQFWGTQNLNGGGSPPTNYIPASSAGDTGMKFQLNLAGTKSFALTTHQHQRGTRMRVWYGSNLDDAQGHLVADNTDWDDPPLVHMSPPLDFPDDMGEAYSSKGLAYRCEWMNNSPYPITFGESAESNEMCFLWHYYYPSQGFLRCIEGFCQQ